MERTFRRLFTVIQVGNSGDFATRAVTVEMERRRQGAEVFRRCRSRGLMVCGTHAAMGKYQGVFPA